MDEELLLKLEGEIDKISAKVLKQIYPDIENIFVNALIQSVYDYYRPTSYDRTYQLISAIDYEIVGNSLIVFINDKKLNYKSAWGGRNVSPAVPYWVQEGHDDDSPINNQFHHYEGRHYLEMAQQLLRQELGIDAEIIIQQPQYV